MPSSASSSSTPVHYAPLELQSTKYDNGTTDSESRPIYNRGDRTRKTCTIGLVLSTVTGIGFIILGAVARGRSKTFHLNSAALELIPLAINVVVLLITECLGYIHSTSLRWALFDEGKLEFNTNLRLLTFSRRSFANGILANIIFFLSLALSYGASSMILVRNTYDLYLNAGEVTVNEVSHLVSISRVTPITLGIAILIQCALATWCLSTSKIPTWSSHPLTTLAAATHKGGLVHRRGRAMMSAHMRSLPARPTSPSARQKSLFTVSPRILYVLIAVTIVLITFVIWAVVMIKLKSDYANRSWAFIPTSTIDSAGGTGSYSTSNMTATIFLKFFTTPDHSAQLVDGTLMHVAEGTMLEILFFCVAIQALLTVGLHCAELQVILLRDEAIWRSLSSSKGSKPESLYNSITQPLKSLPNVLLLTFKPVVHWFFGTALQVDYARGVLMRVPHVTYLMILWFVFLVFVVSISFPRPKGLLPATYGHLQTMADIC